MRRIGIIAVLSLSLVALVAPGVDARDGHRDGRGHGHHQHVLRAWAGQGEQGGTLEIKARVRTNRGHRGHGARIAARCTLSVGAVVHFDVAGKVSDGSTGLAPRWEGSRHFRGSVPVPSEATLGQVPVEVTATCGDRSVMVTVMGEVIAGPGGSDEDPDPPEQPN
jgi:hypothetical protein